MLLNESFGYLYVIRMDHHGDVPWIEGRNWR